MQGPQAAREMRARAAVVAAAAVVLVFTSQWLTVTYNRQGQWTALFCTGTVRPLPALIENERVYRFPGPGFDGQYYHLAAHDPWLTRGLAAYIDDARLRYRRILLPATAHVFALGDDGKVDAAYIAVVLAWIGLGAYWCSRLSVTRGRHPAYGLAFLAIPAVIVSADRMTTDVALLALCVAFVLYAGNARALFAVCLLAPLVRETGILLPAAVSLHALLARDVRRAAVFAAATIPFLAWVSYVSGHTDPAHYPLRYLPLSGIVTALADPRPYLDKHPVIARLDQGADALALVGMLVALGLASSWFRRGVSTAGVAGLLFAAIGLFVQRPDHWHHVFDFGRVYSPLLFFLVVDAKTRGSVSLSPTALMYPRIALQLGSQVVGVVVGAARALGSS